jgi:hypothetical protein
MMKRAMAECFRVLKPGRWLSLCYHDTSEGTWALIQDIMAEVGFVVDRSEKTLFIDAAQKSYNQMPADKTTKRDLVLNFRKRSVVLHRVDRVVDGRTFAEAAAPVIRDYLTSHPGATKDRIYDELVSRMVQAGKMEAHNFEQLLRTVAEEVRQPIKKDLFDNEEPDLFGSHISSRWYLKETADEVDTAEQEKEDAAAARLERHMAAHLRKHPEDEASTTATSSSNTSRSPTSPGGYWPTGSPNTSSRRPPAPGVPPPTTRSESRRPPSARPAPCGGSGGSPTPSSMACPCVTGTGPATTTPSPTGFASAAAPASSSRAVPSTRRAA